MRSLQPLYSIPFALLFFVGLWSFFLPNDNDSDGPRKGKDYALFFAVDNYRSTSAFQDLKNPVRDAEAIAKELREMYDFDTKVYANPSTRDIERILSDWQKRTFQPDDQLFVFFSGHGTFREFNSKGYFVTHGSRTRFDEAYIDLTDIGNAVAKIDCEHILLAIDACYSGTIDQEIALKGGTGRTFIRKGDGADAQRERIIREQLRNRTRLLLTSGGKEQTYDGDDHSPFAGAMLGKLRSAYTTGDGLVLFRDLLSGLDRVTPRPHQGEIPGHEQGGFVFVANAVGTGSGLGDSSSKPFYPPEIPGMVYIEGGTFDMGDQFGDGDDDEDLHTVTLSDYYLGRHEVTFAEYAEYCAAAGKSLPDDEGWGKGERPIINVTWYDAIEYCNWRSEQEDLTPVYRISGSNVTANWDANGYRLPTEAEWEYAALSRGKKEKWAGTSSEDELSGYANYDEKVGKTTKVGSYRPNNKGLHDMSGNVWEWCWDWYDFDHYSFSDGATDPRGPAKGSGRVSRGGSWRDYAGTCRAANRNGWLPGYSTRRFGFRLALSSR